MMFRHCLAYLTYGDHLDAGGEAYGFETNEEPPSYSFLLLNRMNLPLLVRVFWIPTLRTMTACESSGKSFVHGPYVHRQSETCTGRPRHVQAG